VGVTVSRLIAAGKREEELLAAGDPAIPRAKEPLPLASVVNEALDRTLKSMLPTVNSMFPPAVLSLLEEIDGAVVQLPESEREQWKKVPLHQFTPRVREQLRLAALRASRHAGLINLRRGSFSACGRPRTRARRVRHVRRARAPARLDLEDDLAPGRVGR
jgi:hypothetical protein